MISGLVIFLILLHIFDRRRYLWETLEGLILNIELLIAVRILLAAQLGSCILWLFLSKGDQLTKIDSWIFASFSAIAMCGGIAGIVGLRWFQSR